MITVYHSVVGGCVIRPMIRMTFWVSTNACNRFHVCIEICGCFVTGKMIYDSVGVGRCLGRRALFSIRSDWMRLARRLPFGIDDLMVCGVGSHHAFDVVHGVMNIIVIYIYRFSFSARQRWCAFGDLFGAVCNVVVALCNYDFYCSRIDCDGTLSFIGLSPIFIVSNRILSVETLKNQIRLDGTLPGMTQSILSDRPFPAMQMSPSRQTHPNLRINK